MLEWKSLGFVGKSTGGDRKDVGMEETSNENVKSHDHLEKK
jgi:hypothetical protein